MAKQEKPRSLRRNVVWLVVTLVSLYLVFPSLVDTFSSWRQITRFSPLSMLAMFGCRWGSAPACGTCSGSRCPGLAGDR